MKRFALYSLVLLAPAVLVALTSSPAYAVDGVVLISQSTSISGLPGCGTFPGILIIICQPGSYRLSGNLTVTDPTATAVFITSDNVTLDLNGFLILGPTVCQGSPVTCDQSNFSAAGVFASNPITLVAKNVTVRNGTIRGFADAAVSLGSVITGNGSGGGDVVEDIHADGNRFGIFVNSGVVSHCTATSNANEGIFVGTGLARGNIASGNGTIGIVISGGNGGLAVGNTAFGNATGLSLVSQVGYAHNALFANGTNVSGGVNLGGNSCGSTTCP